MNFFRLTDEQIVQEIENYKNKFDNHYSTVQDQTLYATQISTYLIELQRRSALRSEKASRRFARWSLGIAIVAIVISGSLSIVQIVTSVHTTVNCADYGDNTFQCFKFFDAGLISWTKPGEIIHGPE